MALPLLIPVIIAGGTALWGGKKAVKAVMDTNKAKEIDSFAKAKLNSSENRLNNAKNATNKKLAGYGQQKMGAFEHNIRKFVELYEQLSNIELANSAELQNLKLGKFTAVTVNELKNECSMLASSAKSLASGAAGGAMAAFGAYGATMTLASAGTGTAITALSGVAATNATLAWLGGGALAAGGYGVAGGVMVLGSLVAGPALLIFGSVLGASASKKLDEARSNMEIARNYDKEVDGVCQKLEMISEVTTLASETLSNLRSRMRSANNLFRLTIAKEGTDFAKFSQEGKERVFKSVKYAQLVKAVIDTPILNADGGLEPAAKGMFTAVTAEFD